MNSSPECIQKPTGKEAGPEDRFERLSLEIGAKYESLAGIPAFTIDAGDSRALSSIVDCFGADSLFRIINADFTQDAVAFGTDKARVEEGDFRRIVDGAGWDAWRVEEKGEDIGLGKQDVFCAVDYAFFDKENYETISLGLPEDRSAILVFDKTKTQLIGRTDGYAFTDPPNKKDALKGVIRFEKTYLAFEREMGVLETVDEKIEVLEVEVFEKLLDAKDLERAPHIALNIVDLLYQESLNGDSRNSQESIDRMQNLKRIADRLKYEIGTINFADTMLGQIRLIRKSFAKGYSVETVNSFGTDPDFIMETVERYMDKRLKDGKHRQSLLDIIEEAKLLKEQFYR